MYEQIGQLMRGGKTVYYVNNGIGQNRAQILEFDTLAEAQAWCDDKTFKGYKEAEAHGFAGFNGVPHLAVDVPDGGFTITAKTSEGRRITFSFMPYRDKGPPKCVDIQYHDNGGKLTRNGKAPTFDAILIGDTAHKAVPIQHDTRKAEFKPSIVCVLMEDKEEAK